MGRGCCCRRHAVPAPAGAGVRVWRGAEVGRCGDPGGGVLGTVWGLRQASAVSGRALVGGALGRDQVERGRV